MENANVPTGKAYEPMEQAKQIDPGTESHPYEKLNKRKINFTENTEKSGSQKSISFTEVLSQPPPGLSHQQKLQWLQKRRTLGIWAQCDDCQKWRYLPHVLDSSELPHAWYCRMNTDKSIADCSAPETPLHLCEEVELIHSVYSAGSVVWARLDGWPWWPAMIDDCPDVEQFYWLDGFSDIPTYYNVVFFDSHDVTRAWVAPEQLKPYNSNRSLSNHLLKITKYKHRLEIALNQADDAVRLPLSDRLEKYSFIARYKGHIVSPRRISQKDLLKYQKLLKRKFNVEFPIESSSESEDESRIIKKKVPNAKSDSKFFASCIITSNNINAETGLIHNNEHKKFDNSERSNEPDSVAVLVGSDRDVNPSLGTTSNGNNVTTNVDPECLIEASNERSGSQASDDFDF